MPTLLAVTRPLEPSTVTVGLPLVSRRSIYPLAVRSVFGQSSSRWRSLNDPSATPPDGTNSTAVSPTTESVPALVATERLPLGVVVPMPTLLAVTRPLEPFKVMLGLPLVPRTSIYPLAVRLVFGQSSSRLRSLNDPSATPPDGTNS